MKTTIASRFISRVLNKIIVVLDWVIAAMDLPSTPVAEPIAEQPKLAPKARVLITPVPIETPRVLITPAPIAKKARKVAAKQIAPRSLTIPVDSEWVQLENAPLPTIAQMRSLAKLRGLTIPSKITLKSEVWDYLITH